MKRMIRNSEAIIAMSNVRGRHVTVVHELPFSFFYSPSYEQHGPRVKVVFNPDRMRQSNASVQKLCDDWAFIPNENDRRASASEIHEMQQFFRNYLILFLLVWEGYSDEPDPSDYFTGHMSLHELIERIDFYEQYKDEMDQIVTVNQLENFCKHNNLVNMYGN